MARARAVIDADTLYRRHARNLLVWHAIEGLFDLHWSRRILDETRRNLIANAAIARQPATEKANQILSRVTEALTLSRAGSEVPANDVARIESQMTNDPKDRHVLAAAAACGAGTIITTNVKDFPASTTRVHGVTAKTPDDFLLSLLGPDTRDAARSALRHQASFHGWPLEDLLDLLSSSDPQGDAIAPAYVRAIRAG